MKPIVTKLEGDCIVCTSHTKINGYARFKRDGKLQLVHKYVWEKVYGKVPIGMEIMHSCDNPGCINIHHLSIGTHTDNMRDSMNKHRQLLGVNKPLAKLNDEQVISIRISKLSSRKLGAKYGVSHTTILDVLNNINWKHVRDKNVT